MIIHLQEVLLDHFGIREAYVAAQMQVQGSGAQGGQGQQQRGLQHRSSDAGAGGAGPDTGAGAGEQQGGQGEGADPGPKRVIIFTTKRDTVSEVIHCLRRHEPAIRARYFVGQGGRSRWVCANYVHAVGPYLGGAGGTDYRGPTDEVARRTEHEGLTC